MERAHNVHYGVVDWIIPSAGGRAGGNAGPYGGWRECLRGIPPPPCGGPPHLGL